MKPDEIISLRQYLLTRALQTGASGFVALESVASVALTYPNLDMREKRTWSEWERIHNRRSV